MIPIESGLRVELLTEDRHREAHTANRHVLALPGLKERLVQTVHRFSRTVQPRVASDSATSSVAEATS
jgi:hypothetical protein